MIEFNPNSTYHLSALFFGGELKETIKEPILNELGVPVVFKSGTKRGEIKLKNNEVKRPIKGLGLKPIGETKREGVFNTNEAVLKLISKKNSTDAGKIAKIMLNIRNLEKQISTYYCATEELIYDIDDCIHAELCHCGYEKDAKNAGGATQTGRLSSRNPNIQNQPGAKDSKVKEHFVSRYTDGKLIEFDYSQLEVVVFAFLTQDKQLIYDLTKGYDIHKIFASKLLNKSIDCITSQERKLIKPCTFHVIYGGGAGRLASENGLDIEFAKLFIKEFYNRYPEAKQWQDNIVKQVISTKKKINKFTKKNQPIHQGYYKSITGRKYIFETTDARDWELEKGILTSFDPPNIKNYPVQGFATADIVPMMIGRLWRKSLEYSNRCVLINTVHDSVLIDCKKEYVNWCCNFVKNELQSVNEELKKWFGLEFNLEVNVEYTIGNNWRECGL